MFLQNDIYLQVHMTLQPQEPRVTAASELCTGRWQQGNVQRAAVNDLLQAAVTTGCDKLKPTAATSRRLMVQNIRDCI
jgi:hypothetical protein